MHPFEVAQQPDHQGPKVVDNIFILHFKNIFLMMVLNDRQKPRVWDSSCEEHSATHITLVILKLII